MRKSSNGVYAIFVLYFAAVAAAPEFLTRIASPALNAAVFVFCSTLRLYITNRAFSAAFGVCAAIALAGAASRPLRAKSRIFPAAGFAVKLTFAVLYVSLSAAVIVIGPFLDKTYFLLAAAILLIARAAESVILPAQNSTARSPLAAGVGKAVYIIIILAVSSAAEAVSGRMGLVAVGILVSALCLADREGSGAIVRPFRRSFFIVSAVCALAAHGFINGPAAPWCKSWKPGGELNLILPELDAFDIVSADGYLFASFKSGAVVRVSSGGETKRLNLDAPAQRMAWNDRLKLLYVTAYKSDSPVAIIEPRGFKISARVSVPDCAATAVAVSADGGSVYFNCESGYKIVKADAASGAVIRINQMPRGSNIYSLAAARGRVYAISASLDPYLYTLDADSLSVISKEFAGYGNQMAAVGLGGDWLYIARPSASTVAAYDLGRKAFGRAIPAGMIVRDAQQSDKCELLTADYAAGVAREVNICGGAPPRVWRLSPRVRGIWSDSVNGKKYAACACGVYELLK